MDFDESCKVFLNLIVCTKLNVKCGFELHFTLIGTHSPTFAQNRHRGVEFPGLVETVVTTQSHGERRLVPWFSVKTCNFRNLNQILALNIIDIIRKLSGNIKLFHSFPMHVGKDGREVVILENNVKRLKMICRGIFIVIGVKIIIRNEENAVFDSTVSHSKMSINVIGNL